MEEDYKTVELKQGTGLYEIRKTVILDKKTSDMMASLKFSYPSKWRDRDIDLYYYARKLVIQEIAKEEQKAKKVPEQVVVQETKSVNKPTKMKSPRISISLKKENDITDKISKIFLLLVVLGVLVLAIMHPLAFIVIVIILLLV